MDCSLRDVGNDKENEAYHAAKGIMQNRIDEVPLGKYWFLNSLTVSVARQ